MTEDQMYDAAEREMDVYRDQLAKARAATGEMALENIRLAAQNRILREQLAAVAGVATEMHEQAQLIAPASNGPDDMPDMPDQVRAEVLHEYASRIRQAIGPDAVLEGQ